jgi:hypothetical protein
MTDKLPELKMCKHCLSMYSYTETPCNEPKNSLERCEDCAEKWMPITYVESRAIAERLEQIRLELVNGYDGYALKRVVQLQKELTEEKKE